MTKKKKIVLGIVIGTVATLALAVLIPFAILGIRTAAMDKDYSYLKDNHTYNSHAQVSGVELVEQHISCGYATIEMMSGYYGKKITEDELSEKNHGAITTSTSAGFLNELNKSIDDHKFIKHSYLDNDVLLKEINLALRSGYPVALEWAAKYKDEWTLHFSLITTLNIAADYIIIYNPYGYTETISIDEFISRSSFKAYKNMPLFLYFGFAFGAFEKNTIFY